MDFEQWKARFKKEVTADNIKVDWDCGHAYHYMDGHPACEAPADIEDECNDYISDFMMEYGPLLYCIPFNNGCDCPPYDYKKEMPEYVKCYLELANQFNKDHESIIELQQWLMANKLDLVKQI